MFIEINEQNQNIMYITTVTKETVSLSGSTSYRLKYVFANGTIIYEDFNTEADMNTKYDSVMATDCKDTFIEINGKMMNLHWISSYIKDDDTISYIKSSGEAVDEVFDTPSEAEERYEEVVDESHIDLTKYYTKTETNDLISRVLKTEFVNELPDKQHAQLNVIYFVRVTGAQDDVYDEYIFDENKNPEKIGTTRIDLTPYATKEYSDEADATTLSSAKDYADELFESIVLGDEVDF